MRSLRVRAVIFIATSVLALWPGGNALAFGAEGETEMPVEYWCLRGVYGPYIIIGIGFSDEIGAATSGAEGDYDLVPAGPNGCEDLSVVTLASSTTYGGPRPATSALASPAFDVQRYMAIYAAHGLSAADDWARAHTH